MQVSQLRRTLMLATLGAALAPRAWSQSYPTRPVRIAVPAGPGTSTDAVTRFLAEGLAASLRQAVIVENRAGAAGMIGTEAVVKAEADGYTLGMGTVGSLSIVPSMMRSLRFQPTTALEPVAFLGYTPTLLVVRGDSAYQEVKDLVNRARSGLRVAFSSASNGSTGHLGGELLKKMAGVDMTHVPYKEGTQALMAVVGGDVDFMFYHPAAVMPLVRDRKLKALAISSARRISTAADIPTMNETGFGPFDLTAWYMLVAPVGLPDGALVALRAAVRSVTRDPAAAAKLSEQGIEQRDIEYAHLRGFVSDETARWGAIVRSAGARMD